METAEGNIQQKTDKHEAQQNPWLTVSDKSKRHTVNLELNNNKYSAVNIEDDTEVIIIDDEIKASENPAVPV